LIALSSQGEAFASSKTVIARLDRANQYSRASGF